MESVHAVFKDGVFRPTGAVPLPDACEVEFEPRVVPPCEAGRGSPPTPEEWVARWRAWTASMPHRPAAMDDSRGAIYGDDGR